MTRMKRKNILILVVLFLLLILLYHLFGTRLKATPYVLKCDEPSFQLDDAQNLKINSHGEADPSEIKLNNGKYAVLLTRNKLGFEMEEGDTLTVSFTNDNERILQIGLVKDRTMYFRNSKVSSDKKIECSFQLNSKGEYAVYILCADTDFARMSNLEIKLI